MELQCPFDSKNHLVPFTVLSHHTWKTHRALVWAKYYKRSTNSKKQDKDMNQTLIKYTSKNNRHFIVLEHVINVSHEVFVWYLSSLWFRIITSISPMSTKDVRNHIESINFESTLNTIKSLSLNQTDWFLHIFSDTRWSAYIQKHMK